MSNNTAPSTPNQKGVPGIVQDGMSNEGSAEQAGHAGGRNKQDEKEEK